jgi:hypothetical protein
MSEERFRIIAKRLIAIKQKYPRIPKALEPEVKDLFRELRRLGYRNEFILELTGGGWSMSIIKHYVKGTPLGASPTTTEIMNTAGGIAIHYSADSLKKSADILDTLTQKEVPVGDGLDAIAIMVRSGINISYIVSALVQANRLGILASEIPALSEYGQQLRKLGIDFQLLRNLLDQISKFGSPEQLLEVIASYNNNNEIMAKIENSKLLRHNLENEVADLLQELVTLKVERAEADRRFKQVTELTNIGFVSADFKQIADLCRRHGYTRTELFKGIDEFQNLDELKKERNKTRSDLGQLKTEYNSILIYASYCQGLVEKGCDLEYLHNVFELSSRCGDPPTVLKNLKELPVITEENARLGAEVDNLQSSLHTQMSDNTELKKELEKMRQKADDLHSAGINLVKHLVEELSKTRESQNISEEIRQAGIIEVLNKLIDDAAIKRLQTIRIEELQAIFTNEVNRQINAGSWGTAERYLDILTSRATRSPFEALRGKWRIDCKRCGSLGHTLDLTSIDSIEKLLTKGQVEVKASDIYYYLHPHSITVSFREVIRLYLNREIESVRREHNTLSSKESSRYLSRMSSTH